jgi:tetratricopeptide (TPR) repeat protein
MGTIAYDYAAKAYKLKPDDKDVVAANLASYAYYSASFGIVKAIFKGAAGHFKDLANQLIKLDDAYRGAMGYRMLGKFYHVAPWPVGSSKKAVKFFKKAIETDNVALYSHYYLGLLYYQDKKYDLSEKEFKSVWDNEPPDHEKHYIDTYKKMARFYVRQIARITGKKK